MLGDKFIFFNFHSLRKDFVQVVGKRKVLVGILLTINFIFLLKQLLFYSAFPADSVAFIIIST